jgi:1-acyl-sn-glycerol-3-phosphate acyltransferase
MVVCSSPGIISRALAKAAASALGSAVRYGVHLKVHGRENVPRADPVLVVANHRRDSDGPILGYVLGRGKWENLPFFVAREDLFRRGFLRDYGERPTLVRELLGPINVGSVVWAAGARPMRRIPERSVGEVLVDVSEQLGDRPLDAVLRRSLVQRFVECSRSNKIPSVRQVLAVRYRTLLRERRGLYKLTLPCLRKLKAHHRTIIRHQLQQLTELLDRGVMLVLTPEGTVSASGECGRPRGALHALINGPQRAPAVLPVGITYDFMTSGRNTVFVNIGQPRRDLRGLSRAQTDQEVVEAICSKSTVTASQLISKLIFLRRLTGQPLSESTAVEFIASEAKRCAGHGMCVDPRLLDEVGMRRRVGECLRYCVRFGILQRVGRDYYQIVTPRNRAPARWSDPQGAIDYLNNEFDALWLLRTRTATSGPA